MTVNSALNFSCTNTSFTATFHTDRQPGESAIKVSYYLLRNYEFQCESGCWHRSLKEIQMIRFEISGIKGVGVAFLKRIRIFPAGKF